ncbi:MAG: uncharacterized protein JWL62_2703 [Hyphomicrobiales bacterium]|nr:uncharacterized protein [Hyphomicrobiales bacterium]
MNSTRARTAGSNVIEEIAPGTTPVRGTIRALLLGHRIETAGLERPDMINANPLAFHVGSGKVALYRFGVAVLAGLSPVEEEHFLTRLDGRIGGKRAQVDDETAIVETSSLIEDKIPPGGPIQLTDMSDARFLVVADVLAKTVALGRDEREVNAVFDTIEPFAMLLAEKGKVGFPRRSMLRLIGRALLAQHRVSGRVAVDEKPDVLWDRPDLDRLYARLEDEYELKERDQALQRKLDVIVESARAMTDILDTNKSTRLEVTIVALILFELLIGFYQVFVSLTHP